MVKWFGKQWEWVKSFLSESIGDDGIQKGSSKRVGAISVTFTFVFTYIRVALKTNTMPEIPDTWVFILAAVLGITGFVDWLKARSEKK